MQLTHIEAPHGAVSSGSLTIQGHLSRAILSPNASKRFESEDIGPIDLEDATMYWDNSESELSADIIGIYCLQICEFDNFKSLGPSGLILLKINQIPTGGLVFSVSTPR